MATVIQVAGDTNGFKQDVLGSDGRMNVSSRADSRSYYNSRDAGQAYSLVWEMTNAIDTPEYVAYLQNTSTSGKQIVIDAIGVNSELAATFELLYVTGTAAAGTVVTPTNLNATSSNAATANGREGGSAATGITGLTAGAIVDRARCTALGHEEFRLDDRVRLGQNDAVAIRMKLTASSAECDVDGVIFFFFE